MIYIPNFIEKYVIVCWLKATISLSELLYFQQM
jgi:hypothetical protein